MQVSKTTLPGVLIIEPVIHKDSRGFFKETFQIDAYKKAGVDFSFVQDNFSRSKKGTLRGLHFQSKHPQGKLVSCNFGKIFDVVVDINPLSDTFGKYFSIELSDLNNLQLWIPPGYAHGFCVLSDYADFQYKCTDFYVPEYDTGIVWNDPDINIMWPIKDPIISDKDQKLPSFKSIQSTHKW